MCQTFIASIVDNDSNETLKLIELPSDDAPTCGCWLFTESDDEDIVAMQEQVKSALMQLMSEVNYAQHITLELL